MKTDKMEDNKPSAWLKLSVFIGIHMMGIFCNIPWVWGNLSVYCSSYIHSKSENDKGEVAPWLVSLNTIGLTVGVISCDKLRQWLSLRGSLALGITMFNTGVFMSYFAVQYSTVLLDFTLGIFPGVGMGIIQACQYTLVVRWTTFYQGLATSSVESTCVLGSVFINQIITLYINPGNVISDLEVGPIKLFSQSEILDKVPSVFIVYGIVSLSVNCIGFFLLTRNNIGDDMFLVAMCKKVKSCAVKKDEEKRPLTLGSSRGYDVTKNTTTKSSHSGKEITGKTDLRNHIISDLTKSEYCDSDIESTIGSYRKVHKDSIRSVEFSFSFGQKAVIGDSGVWPVLPVEDNNNNKIPIPTDLDSNGNDVTKNTANKSSSNGTEIVGANDLKNHVISDLTKSEYYDSDVESTIASYRKVHKDSIRSVEFSFSVSQKAAIGDSGVWPVLPVEDNNNNKTPIPTDLDSKGNDVTKNTTNKSSSSVKETVGDTVVRNHRVSDLTKTEYHNSDIESTIASYRRRHKDSIRSVEFSFSHRAAIVESGVWPILPVEDDNNNNNKPQISTDLGPKQILKTRVFYTLWLTMAVADFTFIVLTTYYKAFGLVYIHDDHFLTYVGTSMCVGIAVISYIGGIAVDRFGVKVAIVCFVSVMGIISSLFYLTPSIDKWLYLIVCTIYGAFDFGIVCVLSSCALKLWGQTNLSTNYGLVLSSCVITNTVLPPVIELVILTYGWLALFLVIAISIICCMFMCMWQIPRT